MHVIGHNNYNPQSCHWLLPKFFFCLSRLWIEEPRCWQEAARMAAKWYFDEMTVSSLCKCCHAAEHCCPALQGDGPIYESTQLVMAAANSNCSSSQMLQLLAYWQHVALCTDLIHELIEIENRAVSVYLWKKNFSNASRCNDFPN